MCVAIDKTPLEMPSKPTSENFLAVKCTAEKGTSVVKVCAVVKRVCEAMCKKNGSETLNSLGKSVDNMSKDLETLEPPTAEGDLVGGLVK